MADPALLQLQVRQNSEDLQDYLRDLGNWEDEIKKKDAMLYKQKPVLKKVNHWCHVVLSVLVCFAGCCSWSDSVS